MYVQSDTFLLSAVFENFRSMCTNIYEFDTENCYSGPGLAWTAVLKCTKVKLDLLTDIDMLLMLEKGISGGICHSISRYAKANNKYMKGHDMKETYYVQYWDVNNLYGWAILHKLPANNFDWIKDISQFNEDIIEKYIEGSDEGYFLKVDVQYLKKVHELHNDLPFLSERMKIEKVEKLVANLHDKTEYVIHIRKFKQG